MDKDDLERRSNLYLLRLIHESEMNRNEIIKLENEALSIFEEKFLSSGKDIRINLLNDLERELLHSDHLEILEFMTMNSILHLYQETKNEDIYAKNKAFNKFTESIELLHKEQNKNLKRKLNLLGKLRTALID